MAVNRLNHLIAENQEENVIFGDNTFDEINVL